MTASVSPALAGVLRSGRAEFNARFNAARRAHPELDVESFLTFLQRSLDPLANAVARSQSDRLAEVVTAAYDAGLELVGQRQAGPRARHVEVEAGWQRVLPAAVAALVQDPSRVIATVSNALVQLTQTPGVRASEWVERMERVAPRCSDPVTLLGAGQVAAWRAGLAHFRAGALAVADTLPPAVALEALGASPQAAWAPIRARLAVDPWFDPSSPVPPLPGPQVMAWAGTFRGFGGLFRVPPRVMAEGDHFLVRSGEECWLLTADAFGATFHRALPTEAERAHGPATAALPAAIQVEGTTVRAGGLALRLPQLGTFTSVAATATTVAITATHTHAVVLVAPQRKAGP